MLEVCLCSHRCIFVYTHENIICIYKDVLDHIRKQWFGRSQQKRSTLLAKAEWTPFVEGSSDILENQKDSPGTQ